MGPGKYPHPAGQPAADQLHHQVLHEMGDRVVKHVQVLLACYNGGPYLSRQLATLRAQDDPCFPC